MLAYTYKEYGKFEFTDKPKPEIIDSRDAEKQICRERLYLTTGYYNENEEFIHRPDCIVDIYNKLVRKVKKLSLYTELTDIYNGVEWIHKEYVAQCCLQLRNEKGYSLLQG